MRLSVASHDANLGDEFDQHRIVNSTAREKPNAWSGRDRPARSGGQMKRYRSSTLRLRADAERAAENRQRFESRRANAAVIVDDLTNSPFSAKQRAPMHRRPDTGAGHSS